MKQRKMWTVYVRIRQKYAVRGARGGGGKEANTRCSSTSTSTSTSETRRKSKRRTAGGAGVYGQRYGMKCAYNTVSLQCNAVAASSNGMKRTCTPPTVDLRGGSWTEVDEGIVRQVATACADVGFFHVVNHGIDAKTINEFDDMTRAFFALPYDEKLKLKRSADNARGFFDDELTKQRRDWKQAIDIGRPASGTWAIADNHMSNTCLDGFNRFPSDDILPGFRTTMSEYFDRMTALSLHLAKLLIRGLGHGIDGDNDNGVVDEWASSHSSYLRLNYYPICEEGDVVRRDDGKPPPLGISPHKDAGLLTILRQDDDCHSLQVRGRDTDEWMGVRPVPGALTINTGDMLEVISNQQYFAPEHRVLTNARQERYSAPFFFNPGYATRVSPLPSLGAPLFSPLYWGYFRAQRFAGDFSDFGSEIQTGDFLIEEGGDTWHVENQKLFMERADFSRAFSCAVFKPLLTRRS